MLQVQEALCTSCGVCVEACPLDAIQLVESRAQIDQDRCDECGACEEVCPERAIVFVIEPAEVEVAEVAEAARPIPEAPSSKEVVVVQVPPPPAVVEPAPSLVQRAAPIVGAALSFLAQEVGPKLVRLAADMIEDRLTSSRQEAPLEQSPRRVARFNGKRQAGGERRRRRRRGRS